MSRNHVSKLLVGVGVANVPASSVALAALTEGQIIAFDYDLGNAADNAITADTENVGFARGTSVLGEAIIAGPISVGSIIEANNNPYEAPRNKSMTLTVATVPTVGNTPIIKVSYHDNLSIIPNQIKQTTIAVLADAVNTASTTTFAAAIAAEFNKQTAELGGNLFVDVTSATNVVTFVGQTISTQSKYNGIDRPESVNFEIGAPSDVPADGTYTVATTVTLRHGQGDPAKIAWLEEQHMGRLGWSDRRMWNTPKYPSQVDAAVDYETLVINSDSWKEGDMQGLRANPVGAIVCSAATPMGLLEVDLARAGIVPVVVPAST